MRLCWTSVMEPDLWWPLDDPGACAGLALRFVVVIVVIVVAVVVPVSVSVPVGLVSMLVVQWWRSLLHRGW
jgi:hypothetical protein